MWALQDNSGKKILLEQDVVTTVGRRNATIILENDNSISKLHAKITVVKNNDVNFSNELVCTIMDAGSKYGSYIIGKNNKSIPITAEGYRCKPMDRVKFGLQHHEFTLLYTPSYKYITLVSRIYDEEKQELFRVLKKLDGIISEEWNPQCTHVTCPTVKLTEKVACALVAGLYIVTKEYWYAIMEALDKKQNRYLPNPADFTPKIDNSILVTNKMSLLPNPARKLLFNEKTFIFFTADQQEIFSRMIELAGGKIVRYDETWKPQDCCQNNVIVIQSMDLSQSSQTPSFQYRFVCLSLSQEKLRVVPESEIPLAILYCSTQQYCNPRFCYSKLLQLNEKNTAIEDSGAVLALETQEPDFKHPRRIQQDQIIPESASINSQITTQKQSKLSLKTDNQTASKTNEVTIDRQDVISPQTVLVDAENSLKMQSQILKMKNQTSEKNQSKIDRQKIIPETPIEDTQTTSQTQSQMSSQTTSQNSVTLQKEPSNDGKKSGARPRMTKVEMVIPPLFSQTLRQNKQNLNKNIVEISKHKHHDDNSKFELPEKTQQRHNIKSSSAIAMNKRPIEVVSPDISDNEETNNKETLTKKRKLNRLDRADVIQPLNSEKVKSTSKENPLVRINENSVASTDNSFKIGENVERSIHYFSRNNFNKPKCIIPKRLSIDDMYEWKPNRHV